MTANEVTNKEQFIEFITETLIPDLLESGMDYTAMDFARAIIFIKNPKCKEFESWRAEAYLELLRR